MLIAKLISTRIAGRGRSPADAAEADRLSREEVEALLQSELRTIGPLAA